MKMLHFPVVHRNVSKFSMTLIIERPFLDQFMFLGNCPPTPPSPKLTLTSTSHLGQNDGLGEG